MFKSQSHGVLADFPYSKPVHRYNATALPVVRNWTLDGSCEEPGNTAIWWQYEITTKIQSQPSQCLRRYLFTTYFLKQERHDILNQTPPEQCFSYYIVIIVFASSFLFFVLLFRFSSDV